MSQPIEISSSEELEPLIQEGKNMVMFYAPWCSHCQEMKPKYQALKKEYPGVTYYRVNVDQNPQITQDYKVKMIPTFYFFDQGVFAEIPDIEDSEELEHYFNSPSG